MADEKVLDKEIDDAWIEIRRSSNFDKEEALTKLIEARLLARLASSLGDDAFYDGGVCSVCLAPRSDGVHRDDCPVVALRSALQQAWDENVALTSDINASETAKLEAEADVGKIIAWLRSRDAYSDAFKEWCAAKRAEGYELNGGILDLHKDSRFVLDSAADHIEKTWGGERPLAESRAAAIERLTKAAEEMHASLTEIAKWVEDHPLERDRDGGQALDRLLLLKAWGAAIAVSQRIRGE